MDSTPKQPAKENGKGLGETLAEPVQEMAQQGKEKLADLTDQLRSSVGAGIDQRKSSMVASLGTVAETIQEARHKLQESGNDSLGSYLGRGQQLVERLSGYLDEKEVQHIARDVRAYAHRNPTLVVGGLFAAGFLVGRFLRSSAPPEVGDDGESWR